MGLPIPLRRRKANSMRPSPNYVGFLFSVDVVLDSNPALSVFEHTSHIAALYQRPESHLTLGSAAERRQRWTKCHRDPLVHYCLEYKPKFWSGKVRWEVLIGGKPGALATWPPP